MPDRVFPRGRGALLFLILSADALLLPSGLWLDALAAGVLALLIGMGWFALARKYRFADGFALLDRLPHGTARLADGLILVLAALLAVRTAFDLAGFLHEMALPGLPVWLAGGVLLLCAGLLARHGLPALALWAVPSAWAAGGVIALSLLLSLPDWSLPRLTLSTLLAPAGLFRVLGTVFGHALFVLLFTGDDPDLPQTRAALTGVACAALALALSGLRAAAVLGTRCAAALPYPAYTAAGVFAIGDFLQRSEALFGAALSLCFLARAALLLAVCRACLNRLRTRRKQPVSAPPAA